VCENLVAAGKIPKKNIKFVKAIAGGGSLVKAVTDGKLHAFEFATPLDDTSQLFGLPEGNPGTVGTRYLHYPGWHQPFLITYMIINKSVWKKLSPAQQALVLSVGRDHVISSFGFMSAAATGTGRYAKYPTTFGSWTGPTLTERTVGIRYLNRAKEIGNNLCKPAA
jgi:hypothetical protein